VFVLRIHVGVLAQNEVDQVEVAILRDDIVPFDTRYLNRWCKSTKQNLRGDVQRSVPIDRIRNVYVLFLQQANKFIELGT
jgi:hypothetical protein